MNKWAIRYRLLKDGDDGDEGSNKEGEEGQNGKEGEKNEEKDHQTRSESPFKDPRLAKYGSEADLAELISVQETLVKSNRKRITDLEEAVNRSRNNPPPKEEEKKEFDATEFFKKPHELIRQILKEEMGEIVAPLISDVRESRRKSVWDSASKLPKFDMYREAVEDKIRGFGITSENVTEALIEEVYYSVVGRAASEGNFRFQDEEEEDRGRSDDRPNSRQRMSPQHRASSHPDRPKDDGKPKPRELTEEEKSYARIQFRGSKDPYGDYLKWGEMGDADVATFELEEEGKK